VAKIQKCIAVGPVGLLYYANLLIIIIIQEAFRK